jgi:hypothetical protein
MRQWVRVTLMGAFASALLGLLPYAITPANAQNEISLNSSTVQIVHIGLNNDLLNMSLNVTSAGDSGDCDGEDDDLLETGVHLSVSVFSCGTYAFICGAIGCPTFDFDAQVNYVEHQIGSSSYGTSFGPNAAGTVSSKIVSAATTPINTCGTWTINLQATGQDFSEITGTPVSLFINDSDGDADGGSGAACFDVAAIVGNGIVKPHHGVHKTRHK